MVSEDLVEQDAKVRLGRSLGWVASRQGQVGGPGTIQTRLRLVKGGQVPWAPVLGQSPTSAAP